MNLRILSALAFLTVIFLTPTLWSGGERDPERGGNTINKKKESAPQTGQVDKDEVILKVEGKLTKDDPKDRVRKESSCKVHKVKLEAGKTYQIDLVSDDFDAFLRLEDDAGKQLAEDDDSGGGTNARIVFRCKKSGAHVAFITSYEARQGGKYRLTVLLIGKAELAREELARQARELKMQAYRDYVNGKPLQALAAFEAAFQIEEKLYPPERFPQGHPDIAGTLNSLGAVYSDLGQPKKAADYYARALAEFERVYTRDRFPHGHPHLATSLNNMGYALADLGDPGKALEYHKKALAMRERLFPPDRFPHGHPELAQSFHNLGHAFHALAQPAKALESYEKAISIRENVQSPDLAVSLNNVGALLEGLGQPNRALPYYEKALALRQGLYPPEQFPGGHPDLAKSLNNLAFALESMGQPSKAFPYHEKALGMFQKLYPADKFPNGHPHLATALSNLGFVLLTLDQTERALPYFEKSLAMREKVYSADRFSQGHEELVTSYIDMVGILLRLNLTAKAQTFAEKALAMSERLYPIERFPRGHPTLASAKNAMGGVLQSNDRLAESLRYCREAIAMFRSLYPPERFPLGHPRLANYLNNLGRLLERLDQIPEARNAQESSLAMKNGLFEVQVSNVSESAAIASYRGVKETLSDLLSLGNSTRPSAEYKLVFDTRSLLPHLLYDRHQALRIALKESKEVQAIWTDLQGTRRQLGRLALIPLPREPDRLKVRDNNMRDAMDRKEKLEAELAKLALRTSRGENGKDVASIVKEKLPAGTVFVDFTRYSFRVRGQYQGERYLAFVLARDREVQRIDLGPAKDIESAARAWRKDIDAGIPSKHADKLSELVWQKLAPHIPTDTTTLYLAPDGDLQRIPFAALPGKKPGTVLLEDYAIATVPYAGYLLEQLLYPPVYPKGPEQVVVVGDVTYGEKDKKVAKYWPALDGTKKELDLVCGFKPKSIALSGKEATPTAVAKALGQARYAHLATHGFFAEKELTEERLLQKKQLENWAFRSGSFTEWQGMGGRSPLVYTGLALAGANLVEHSLMPRENEKLTEGAILTGEGIVAQPLEGLKLAVLSACETGLGDLTEGEAVAGLQRAFHVAGCANVIASLWKVDDDATAALMGMFYRNLWVEKKTPLEALRLAQLHLYRHPEQIPALAKLRGIDFTESDLPKITAPPSAGKRANTSQWAAFVLSGVGR